MALAKNIIEKSNVLNMMKIELAKKETMTLNELRFFCLYLSKINARDSNSRTVSIPLSDFEELFSVKINTTQFEEKMENILRRIVSIRKENGKKTLATLYSKFEWSDTADCKEIEITCNYDIFPYLFELKGNYTSYIISNIAKLNTVSKIRLYEICKQYEKIKTIKIEIGELQQSLYSREELFKNFRLRVLEPAINDINKYTDVFVSYEKVLKMRKVVAIKFTIVPQKRKEDNSKIDISTPEPLQIATTQPVQPVQPNNTDDIQSDTNDTQCHTFDDSKLHNAYNKFSFDEIENIYQTIHNHFETEKECTVLMNDAVLSLDAQKVKKTIKNQFNYLLKIVSTKIIEKENNMQKYSEKNDKLPMSEAKRKRDGNKLQTYTLDGVDDLVIRTEDLIQSETENATE